MGGCGKGHGQRSAQDNERLDGGRGEAGAGVALVTSKAKSLTVLHVWSEATQSWLAGQREGGAGMGSVASASFRLAIADCIGRARYAVTGGSWVRHHVPVNADSFG